MEDDFSLDMSAVMALGQYDTQPNDCTRSPYNLNVSFTQERALIKQNSKPVQNNAFRYLTVYGHLPALGLDLCIPVGDITPTQKSLAPFIYNSVQAGLLLIHQFPQGVQIWSLTIYFTELFPINGLNNKQKMEIATNLGIPPEMRNDIKVYRNPNFKCKKNFHVELRQMASQFIEFLSKAFKSKAQTIHQLEIGELKQPDSINADTLTTIIKMAKKIVPLQMDSILKAFFIQSGLDSITRQTNVNLLKQKVIFEFENTIFGQLHQALQKNYQFCIPKLSEIKIKYVTSEERLRQIGVLKHNIEEQWSKAFNDLEVHSNPNAIFNFNVKQIYDTMPIDVESPATFNVWGFQFMLVAMLVSQQFFKPNPTKYHSFMLLQGKTNSGKTQMSNIMQKFFKAYNVPQAGGRQFIEQRQQTGDIQGSSILVMEEFRHDLFPCPEFLKQFNRYVDCTNSNKMELKYRQADTYIKPATQWLLLSQNQLTGFKDSIDKADERTYMAALGRGTQLFIPVQNYTCVQIPYLQEYTAAFMYVHFCISHTQFAIKNELMEHAKQLIAMYPSLMTDVIFFSRPSIKALIAKGLPTEEMLNDYQCCYTDFAVDKQDEILATQSQKLKKQIENIASTYAQTDDQNDIEIEQFINELQGRIKEPMEEEKWNALQQEAAKHLHGDQIVENLRINLIDDVNYENSLVRKDDDRQQDNSLNYYDSD